MDIILCDKSRHNSPRKFWVKAGSAAIADILICCIWCGVFTEYI